MRPSRTFLLVQEIRKAYLNLVEVNTRTNAQELLVWAVMFSEGPGPFREDILRQIRALRCVQLNTEQILAELESR